MDITVGELLAQVQGDGAAITERQLERWHKAGLLPRRRQIHVAGLRGSVGVYDGTVVSRVLRLTELHLTHRSLTGLQFSLWWEGFDVPDVQIRRTLMRLVGKPRQPPADADLEEVAERLLEHTKR